MNSGEINSGESGFGRKWIREKVDSGESGFRGKKKLENFLKKGEKRYWSGIKGLFIPLLIYAGRKIEQRRFSDPPIYIGGCGRSGTTLLLSVLSAHKEIFACPSELHLFDGAYETDSVVIAPKFYRLFRTFLTKRIKPSAKRYCEKSPVNIRQVPLIEKYHQGNFRLIQIVRDGRDVILSGHPRSQGKYWVEPERWINDVSEGLKYLDHPSVYTIRYEDLIINYRETIEAVCQFLEIPVSEEILNWHRYATVRQNNALFSRIAEISTASIGKWRNPEKSERVKQLTKKPEAIALLNKYNYLD